MRLARRGAAGVQLCQLQPLAGEDLAALRANVEQTISRSRKLREMAARTGYTPEDVASEALVRYLGTSDPEIENPAAWMVTAARNFVYDLHKKGLQRETAAEPGSHTLDQPRPGDQLPVDESLDRRFESRLYDAAIRRLDERDRRAVAAFEQEGSMRGVERRYGIPKSNVQRAFKRLQREIASESGPRAPRRARSRALAYHLGFLSPSQTEELQSRLSWDTGLLMELRALQLGARRTAALFPLPAAVETSGVGPPGVIDRVAALVDRGREGMHWALTRTGGHETEAAGVATGGAGIATKAIVVACIGGSAAAGVCVERGVLDLPGAGAREPQEQEAAEVTEAPANTTLPGIPPTPPEPAVAPAPAPEPALTPAQQRERDFGFEAAGASSDSRDLGGSPSASGSSGSGGGGGSRESFGP